MAGQVLIRPLREISDFEKLLDIQRIIWNHDEAELTPVHHFCVSTKMGGIVLGAFVDGELAGFVYSYPAFDGKKCWQHSQMLAVLPPFQGLGIGERLKWAQRREALKQGIDCITWTFDPLQAKNANLNLHALGAKSRKYFPNFYGFIPTLCLVPGIPADRLLVEWPLNDNRVLNRKINMGRIDRKRGGGGPRRNVPLVPGAMPKALELGKTKRGSFAMPAPPKLNIREHAILVEIPPDINVLKPCPEAVASWRTGLRRVLQTYFKRGYAADDFVFGERCFYVLKK